MMALPLEVSFGPSQQLTNKSTSDKDGLVAKLIKSAAQEFAALSGSISGLSQVIPDSISDQECYNLAGDVPPTIGGEFVTHTQHTHSALSRPLGWAIQCKRATYASACRRDYIQDCIYHSVCYRLGLGSSGGALAHRRRQWTSFDI